MAVKVVVSGPTMDIESSTFDISKFKANIGNYHKTSRFQMYIHVPTILENVFKNDTNSNLSNTAKKLMFDIEKVVMPGISFATEDIRRQGYGYIERKPYSPIMETINCIVRSDSEGKNYDYFQTWLKSVMDYQIEGSIDSQDHFSIGPWDAHYYELNYKDDYSATVEIAAINESSEAAIHLILYEVYPIYIGDMNYDWADMNNIVKFPIKLTYSYWKQSRYYSTTNNTTANTSG